MNWQPISTAPQSGYMLVYEDGATRALIRLDGVWKHTAYPMLISKPWGDRLVGDAVKRILDPLGLSLGLGDGCCENPTHWMPLPPPPKD